MSQENVEIVKGVYGAFAGGGVEAVVPSFAPDVVIHPFPEWVEQPTYRGHDGLRAILTLWIENFDDFKLEVSEVREVGDRVLALGEIAGRIKGSGVPIRQPVGSCIRTSATVRSAARATSLPRNRLSKPRGCRSKTLTPTPEVRCAGFCSARKEATAEDVR